MSETLPLILTLKLDAQSFGYFDQLRQQHFPVERNFLSAHITLFHALPGDRISSIQQTLQQVCPPTPMLSLRFPGLRFLGQGVAIEVESAELIQLRQQLAKQWQEWLSRQDQQKYRPHVTIQNKTSPDVARQLYNQLRDDWQPFEGKGEGLLLWYYKGGPWELANEFHFG